jgi:hypothetical protein
VAALAVAALLRSSKGALTLSNQEKHLGNQTLAPMQRDPDNGVGGSGQISPM